jgi:hypothetical protein
MSSIPGCWLGENKWGWKAGKRTAQNYNLVIFVTCTMNRMLEIVHIHELVDLGHSVTHAMAGLCRDETRTSEQIGISPVEEGWTVAHNNEMHLVAALTCKVLRHGMQLKTWDGILIIIVDVMCRLSTEKTW